MHPKKILFSTVLIFFFCSYLPVFAQSSADDDESAELKYLRRGFESLRHRLDELEKAIDDILWYHKVGDVAYVDKVRIVGPPRWKEPNPTAQGAGNPIKFYSYEDFERQNSVRTLVLQIIDGKFETIWPLDLAKSQFLPPAQR